MILNILTSCCDLKEHELTTSGRGRHQSAICAETCNYQLLCHVDPSHVSIRPNQFTKSIAVSAGATAEVQDSAALELCWKWKTTAEEPEESQ